MQRIFIDSRDRVSGVNEEFSISLPKSIVVPFESLAVLDTVLIPTSTYTVNESNRFLYYTETNLDDNTFYQVAALQSGFYSVESLGIELARAMNGNASKQVHNLYEVTYVPRTGKYVIDITLQENERVAVVTKEFLDAKWENLAEGGSTRNS